MTDDSLLDTPVPPSTQALSARLTLAALDGAPDRVQAGLLEAIADPITAIAVIGRSPSTWPSPWDWSWGTTGCR